MPKKAEPLQIQPARKLGGWSSRVQLLQLAHYELAVARCHGQKAIDQAIRLVTRQVLRIVRRRSGDHAVVRQHDDEGSVRRVEPHHDVAVTCQILGECREVRGQSSPTSPHYRDGIGALFLRYVGIRRAMDSDHGQISRKESTHQDAGMLHQGQAPWRLALVQHSGVLMSRFFTRDLSVVRVHSSSDPDISQEERSYPVAIMRAGGGALTTDFTTLAEDLASHGYVVVGFDAPYRTFVVVLPDNRVVTRPPANNPENLPGDQADRLINGLLPMWTSDTKFVVSQLEQLNATH